MEVSRNWRLQKYRYGLIGKRCEDCGIKIFPPRDVCPNCAEVIAQAMLEIATRRQPSIPVVLLESK